MNRQAGSLSQHGTPKGVMQHALREIVFSIFIRKTVVLVIFIGVFVFALLMAILLPPVYRATAKFSMTIPVTFDPLERETIYEYKNKFQRELNTQKELIMSNRVLLKVIEQLKLAKGEKIPRALDKLREKLEVVPPKGETFEGTTFFFLNYEDRKPKRAAQFAHTIEKAYLDTYRELAQEKAEYSYAFFREQTQKLYQKMLGKEKVLRDYEREKAVQLIEILNLEPGASANLEVGPSALLTRFMGKYHELQEELAGIRIEIENLEKTKTPKGEIPVILPEMEVAGRAITVFKRKVAQLQIQLNEMKPRFKERYDLLRQIEKELDLNISSLKGELERSLKANKIRAQSLEARLQELERTIQGLKAHIENTAQERSVYQQLKQDYDIAKNAYIRATNQLEQARLSQALNKEKQHVTLVDEPVVPAKPIKPNRPLIIVLGLFAGIFLGIAISLMLDFFDHSIRKNEDIEHHLEITVLGSIPQIS